jgi:hypothetical protein
MAFGNRTLAPAAILQPEAPDAYRYAPAYTASYGYRRINDIRCTDGDTTCEQNRQYFYQSCRTFEPWPEIDSVTLDSQDVVKVTLKTRVHHCSTAPGTIARAVSGWDASALAAEPYRTWENGIREYLLNQTTGYGGSNKIGDQGWASGVASGFSDTPQSTIFPRFYLVQQIPKPRVDGNGLVNLADSPTWHDIQRQTELYLRAICSGFVDGITTATTACTDSNSAGPYDYTFEALVYHATGGKWFSPLASKTTSFLGTDSIRPDRPMGFGPLPTLLMHAEGFSAISKAINLLNRFRVMIPATLQSRGAVKSIDYPDANTKNANMLTVPPSGGTASGVGTYAVWDNGSWALPTPASGDWTAWGDLTAGSGIQGAASINGVSIMGGNGIVSVGNNPAQYRWNGEVDTTLILPTGFADLLSFGPVVYGQYWETTTTVLGHQQVTSFSGTQCHVAGAPTDNVWGNSLGAWLWVIQNTEGAHNCQEITGGDLSISGLPSGFTFGTRNDAGGVIAFQNNGAAKTRNISLGQATIPVIAVPLVASNSPTLSPVI